MSVLEQQLDQGLQKVSCIDPDEYYRGDSFRNLTIEDLLRQYSSYSEKMTIKDIEKMVTDFQRYFIQSGVIRKTYGIKEFHTEPNSDADKLEDKRGQNVENAVREYLVHLRQKVPANEEIRTQILQKCLDFSKFIIYDKPHIEEIIEKAHNLSIRDFKIEPKNIPIEEPKKPDVIDLLEQERKKKFHSRTFRDYLGPEGTKNLDDLVKECPYNACLGEREIIGCTKFMLERILKGITDGALLDRIALIAVRMKNEYLFNIEKRKDLEKKNKLQKSTIPLTHSKNILADLYSMLGMKSIPKERIYVGMKTRTKYEEIISKITDSILPHYERCQNIDPMKDDYLIAGELKDALRKSSRNYDDETGNIVVLNAESLPPVEAISLNVEGIEKKASGITDAKKSNVLQFPRRYITTTPKKIMIKTAKKKETAVLHSLVDASNSIEDYLKEIVSNSPKADDRTANVRYYLDLFSARESMKSLRSRIDSTLYHYDNYLKITEKEQIDLKEVLREKYCSLKRFMDIALKFIDTPFKNLKEMNVDVKDFRFAMGDHYKKLENSVEFLNWTALMISSSDYLNNVLRKRALYGNKQKYGSMAEIRGELSDIINTCKRIYKEESYRPLEKPKSAKIISFEKAEEKYETLSKSAEAEPVKMARPQVTVISNANMFNSMDLFNQYILATKTESEGMYHEDVKKAERKIFNSYFAKLDLIDPGLKRVIDLSPSKKEAHKRVEEVFQLRKDINRYVEGSRKIHNTLTIFDKSDFGSRKGSEYHSRKIDFTNLVIYETTQLDRLLRRKQALGDMNDEDLRLNAQNILNNYHACYHKVKGMIKTGIQHDVKPQEAYAHDEYMRYVAATNTNTSNNLARAA